MAAIKLSTNLEQSKKLIELGLDVNTADMHYFSDGYNPTKLNVGYSAENAKFYRGTENEYIPAWSLTALLGVLPLVDFTTPQLIGTPKTLYRCMYNDDLKSHAYDNPIDACVEMIHKLKEDDKL